MSTFLELARARGWAVFAADPGKKFSCSPEWQEAARAPDYDWLEAKAAEGWNIGWAMGEQPNGQTLVALDVEAPYRESFLANWPVLYGPAGGPTYMQRSKSGGLHVVFQGDVPSTKLKMSGGVIGDVVSHGKQILAAGSVVDGRPYVMLSSAEPALIPPRWLEAVERDRGDLSPAPGNWRQDELSRARATEYLATEAKPAIRKQGGHNALLTAVVRVVKAMQLEPTLALQLLLEVYNPRCEPPWLDHDVAHKVHEVVQGRAGEGVEWGQYWLHQDTLQGAPVAPAPPGQSVFARIHANEMAKPLEPLVFLAEALQLAPGAVTILAGYGFSGKTYVAQNIALAVATGQRLWGKEVSAGKVLHLDYEQGRRVTIERYQRLATGLGQDLGAANLELVVYPPLWLTSERAADILSAELEGHALCIVDSLRAGSPSLDENSSEFRQPLDTLNLISERTGCTVVVVAHGGKASESNRTGIRGSSAIYDAAASVFYLEKEDDGPIHAKQVKARLTGVPVKPFTLAFEETAPAGVGGLSGVRLVMGEAETRNAREEAQMRSALKMLSEHPDGVTMRQLSMVCPRALLDELELAGRIVKEGNIYKRGVL